MESAEGELSIDSQSWYPEHVIKVGKITFGEKKDKLPEKIHKEIREKIKKECPEKSNKEVEGEISKFKKERREKLDRQEVCLSQAACALLNSGGGVITAEIENESYSLEKYGLGLDTLRSLKKCIQYSEFSEYFDYKQVESSMFIFVKSWSSENSAYPRVCSVSTGLYQRDDSSATIRDPKNVLSFLRRKRGGVIGCSGIEGEPASKQACLRTDVPPSSEVSMQEEEEAALPEAATQFLKLHELIYGSSLNFAESQTIELKEFPANGDILEFVESKLPCYVSAFASTEGGLILFGVDDNGIILGHKQNVYRHQLENTVQKIIFGLLNFHFCASKEQVDFRVKTLPVYDINKASCGCVLAVTIKPFCCAVFSEPPDSWVVKDSNLERIGASEWCQLMTEEDQDEPKLIDMFNRLMSISHKPLFFKPLYSKDDIRLEDLQNFLFPVNSNGITLMPEKLCPELFSEYPGLENIMKKKMEELQVSKGLLIFSRSWAVDVGLDQNPYVACDILLVATKIFPMLYTIIVERCDFFSLTKYSRDVARKLKLKLVNEGGYTRKVCVIPHVIELGANGDIERDTSLVIYPSAYEVSKKYLKEFVQSLVIVLLKFKSALSDQLGYEIFNLLTLEQYEILKMDLHKTPKLFIYGLPGSGKTIIAKEIIKRIKNVFKCTNEEVLYICENRPLCDTVRQEKICQAVTRTTFLDKVCQEQKSPVKHIIIDEAQNFRSEGKSWYEEARSMTAGSGVLWIFLDYLQTTHTFDRGLPPPSDQYPQQWLTVGVRNATQIHEEMLQQEIRIISDRTRLNIPYGTLEVRLKNATCGHSLKGVLKKPQKTDRDGIVTYIVRECISYLRNGYSVENIAVLCNTTNERDFYKPLLVQKMSREMIKLRLKVAFITLDEGKGKGIVIDSVRRFSGLERYIVFAILPHSVQWEIADNVLLCMVSRANLHCHLLHEMEKD